MKRNALAVLGILAAVTLPALAASGAASKLEVAPPPAPYEKVSIAIKGLPDFIPSMGAVYVDPKTLPGGPYLGYDHQGKLVDTTYMISVKDFDAHRTIGDMGVPVGEVDHIGVYFNPGHAGIAEPHYHIVLWHVSRQDEKLVAK